MKNPSLCAVLFPCLASALLISSAPAQSTTRVNVDSAGVQSNAYSWSSSIAAGGRHVAFRSDATNLVPGDTNGEEDVFVHDRLTGLTKRVSVDSAGVQGNQGAAGWSISGDGTYVAYTSESTNLVAGDTNGAQDIFVHNCLTGITFRVNVASGGGQSNGPSHSPDISSDGHFVSFSSYANNLVPGDANGLQDVFIHEIQTGITSLVSLNSAGAQGNAYTNTSALSSDGRIVAFVSQSTNFVANDTNGVADVFVRDRLTGLTTRVSVDSAGVEGNDSNAKPSVSADGRFVAFYSYADNLVPGDINGLTDVFVHDRQTARTRRVSVDSLGQGGNMAGNSTYPAISADGRYVAFYSGASNLVANDTNHTGDMFVHDQLTAQTSRVSVDSAGLQADGESTYVSISADGLIVAFSSRATNLVPGDTNGNQDIFVHDRTGAGPSLAQSGTCPGALALTINGATGGGQVVLVHGAPGVFVKSTQPCVGLTLGINPPAFGTMLTANGAGTAVLNFNVPAGFCGRSVQGVDVTTCTATNVIVL